MPISFFVDKTRQRIVANLDGEISITEIFDTIQSSLRHPDFQPGYNILSDHRKIERVITPDEVESTINLLAGYVDSIRNTKWAIVTRKPASYGMMRLLSVHAERIPMKVRVFKDMKAAENWLNSHDSHEDRH